MKMGGHITVEPSVSRCDFACHYCTVLYFVRLSVQLKTKTPKKNMHNVICVPIGFLFSGAYPFSSYGPKLCFARTDGRVRL